MFEKPILLTTPVKAPSGQFVSFTTGVAEEQLVHRICLKVLSLKSWTIGCRILLLNAGVKTANPIHLQSYTSCWLDSSGTHDQNLLSV